MLLIGINDLANLGMNAPGNDDFSWKLFKAAPTVADRWVVLDMAIALILCKYTPPNRWQHQPGVKRVALEPASCMCLAAPGKGSRNGASSCPHISWLVARRAAPCRNLAGCPAPLVQNRGDG